MFIQITIGQTPTSKIFTDFLDAFCHKIKFAIFPSIISLSRSTRMYAVHSCAASAANWVKKSPGHLASERAERCITISNPFHWEDFLILSQLNEKGEPKEASAVTRRKTYGKCFRKKAENFLSSHHQLVCAHLAFRLHLQCFSGGKTEDEKKEKNN